MSGAIHAERGKKATFEALNQLLQSLVDAAHIRDHVRINITGLEKLLEDSEDSPQNVMMKKMVSRGPTTAVHEYDMTALARGANDAAPCVEQVFAAFTDKHGNGYLLAEFIEGQTLKDFRGSQQFKQHSKDLKQQALRCVKKFRENKVCNVHWWW